MQLIYQTKGRAKEFCEHALNLYRGCAHQCTYCYVPAITYNPKFRDLVEERMTYEDIVKSALEWKDRLAGKPVLLCFSSDPYQPLEQRAMLARSAIQILNTNGIPVHILTKAGKLPLRDFDLLSSFPGNAFATTLTFTDEEDRQKWEPGAGSIGDRVENLIIAQRRGIDTWASLEPVIYPEQSLEILKMVHPFVNHFKVGQLNYEPHAQTIDWRDYALKAVVYLREIDKTAYIKKDLVKHLFPDENRGVWINEKDRSVD